MGNIKNINKIIKIEVVLDKGIDSTDSSITHLFECFTKLTEHTLFYRSSIKELKNSNFKGVFEFYNNEDYLDWFGIIIDYLIVGMYLNKEDISISRIFIDVNTDKILKTEKFSLKLLNYLYKKQMKIFEKEEK